MKSIFFAIILVTLSTSKVAAQQEVSLHFMDSLWQSNLTNPAKLPNENVYVLLPSVYANFSHTGFSYSDLIRNQNGTTLIDVDNVLSKLRTNSYLQAHAYVRPLTIGFKAGGMGFSLSYAAKFNGFLNYPKTLIDLGWNGNANYIGQTVNVSPDIQFMAYQEYSLGWQTPITQSLGIGFKWKFLVGNADISTKQPEATLYTDPEIYQLTLATDIQINSSGLPNLLDSNMTFVTPPVSPNNNGFAADIGAYYRINDKLNVFASVLDIGAIRWRNEVNNYVSNGEFSFEGVNINNLVEGGQEVNFDAVLDTIATRFKFNRKSEAYTTVLPTKLYLSANYEIIEDLNLGGLLHMEFYKGQVLPAIAITARKNFGKIFMIGATYAVRNRRFDNFGMYMHLRVKPFQLFLLTDNVFPLFQPYRAQNTNLRFGINLAF